MSSSVKAGWTNGWSSMDQWRSFLSTIWWPVRFGPLTHSFIMARNLWPTTWPCPTNFWGSWRMERCSTLWGTWLFTSVFLFEDTNVKLQASTCFIRAELSVMECWWWAASALKSVSYNLDTYCCFLCFQIILPWCINVLIPNVKGDLRPQCNRHLFCAKYFQELFCHLSSLTQFHRDNISDFWLCSDWN